MLAIVFTYFFAVFDQSQSELQSKIFVFLSCCPPAANARSECHNARSTSHSATCWPKTNVVQDKSYIVQSLTLFTLKIMFLISIKFSYTNLTIAVNHV